MVAITGTESAISRQRSRPPSRSHALAHPETRGPARESRVSGRRYLQTDTGRWISRDPAEETGGENLFGFVGNAPPFRNDWLGLRTAGLAECIRASRFTIKMTDGLLISPGQDAGKVIVVIQAYLDPVACACVCEYPNFKQTVRGYRGWFLGQPSQDWHPEPWRRDFADARNGTFYDDTTNPSRFHHLMVDAPGIAERWYVGNGWRRRIFTPLHSYMKRDFETQVLCTSGSAACGYQTGRVIRVVLWGIEVTYNRQPYSSAHEWIKSWWPSGPYPLNF